MAQEGSFNFVPPRLSNTARWRSGLHTGQRGKYKLKANELKESLQAAEERNLELENKIQQMEENAAGANADKRTGGAMNIESLITSSPLQGPPQTDWNFLSASNDALQVGVDILTDENKTLRGALQELKEANKTLSGALQELKDELQEAKDALQGQIELVQILKGGGVSDLAYDPGMERFGPGMYLTTPGATPTGSPGKRR